MDYATQSERVLYNKDILKTVDHSPLIADKSVTEKSDGRQKSGCSCNSKHAVILLNIIYILLNSLGLAFIIWADKVINNSDATVAMEGSEITDDQKNTFKMAYPYFFTLFCITLLVNVSTIFAAKSDDYCLVVLGTVWYLFQMALNIWLSVQMGFKALLIISILWFAILLIPHGVFVYEVNSIMGEETENVIRDTSW